MAFNNAGLTLSTRKMEEIAETNVGILRLATVTQCEMGLSKSKTNLDKWDKPVLVTQGSWHIEPRFPPQDGGNWTRLLDVCAISLLQGAAVFWTSSLTLIDGDWNPICLTTEESLGLIEVEAVESSNVAGTGRISGLLCCHFWGDDDNDAAPGRSTM